jgi:PAS domain S-box-containing protein
MRMLRALRALRLPDLIGRLRRRPAQTRDALEESERVLGLFISSVADYAIFMLDAGGRIATWNRGAERIKGYTVDEVVGRHFGMFYGEADRARKHPAWELGEASRNGRYEEEGWRIRKDGTRFWASVTITAVRDHSGRLVGFGKVTRDLTERKRNEEVLREAIAEAEASSRAKSEFLAAMSHELRTPLNAIMGFADLLDQGVSGPLNAMQRDHVGRIRTASKHLLLQIDQILSISKIEAGHEEVHAGPVDCRALAEDALALIEPMARAKGLGTRFDGPDEPVPANTDGDKVQQILINLLSNACKFTEQGEIGLRLERDDARNVLFHVWDTGIGIAPADQARIFERFTQVDQSRTRARGGAGLGLAIAQHLARLLHGDLMLASTPGRGSTFTLRVPAAHEPGRAREVGVGIS